MPSESLTRLLGRKDGQATSNGLIDHTSPPDLSEEARSCVAR